MSTFFGKFSSEHNNLRDSPCNFRSLGYAKMKDESPILSGQDKVIYKIVIQSKGKIIFSKEYKNEDHEEFDKLLNACKIEKKSYTPLESMLMTTRINTVNNFAKDFFIPTTGNYTSNIENVVLKGVAGIFSVFLDILTLPVRILTLPFRVIAIKISEHPLQKIFKEKLAGDLDELYVKAYEVKKKEGFLYKVMEKEAFGYIHLVDVPKSETYGGFYGKRQEFDEGIACRERNIFQQEYERQLREEKQKFDKALGLLGLKAGYTSAELSKAFRKKALPIHPDKTVNDSEEVKKLKNAEYEALSNARDLLQEKLDSKNS